MLVRRETAIRELEAVRSLLEEWVGKLQVAQAQSVPVIDGLGQVIGERSVAVDAPTEDTTVEDFLGEKTAQSFAAELVVVAHKLEGLAST